jgi:formate-dependent nitrite reductase cytochrome c552 subunit
MRPVSRIFIVVILAAWCRAARDARAESCVKCHLKPAEAVTDPQIFDRERWEAGVHAGVDCTRCHPGADPKAFDDLPHRLGDPPPACANCHNDDFEKTAGEVARSVHAARVDDFSCVQCHDPHAMHSGLAALPREERVRVSNHSCIE